MNKTTSLSIIEGMANNMDIKKVNELLKELREAKIAVWVKNDKMQFSSPNEDIYNQYKPLLLSHKLELIRLLSLNEIHSQSDFIRNTIFRFPVGDKTPLSFAQERLWFIEQYEQGSNAYHIPMVIELSNKIATSVFEQALHYLVERHQILRTVFKRDEQGKDYQLVLNEPLKVEYRPMLLKFEFSELLQQDINRVFNLNEDYPIRVVFYGLAGENQPINGMADYRYVLINIHHIAFDGWSTNIFIHELHKVCEALAQNKEPVLKKLTINYQDFACWQRGYLQGEVIKNQLRFWQEKLQNIEHLALATDYPRREQVDYHGRDIHFFLEKVTSKKLKSLAKDKGCTLFSVLLSAFYIFLYKYTDQDNIVVGTPVANRHYSQLEDLIGFFVNNLVLPQTIEAEHTAADLISAVHQNMCEAQQHQDIPFDRLVDNLNVDKEQSMHPIFQIMFGLYDFSGEDSLYFHAADIENQYNVAKFDLTLLMSDKGDVIEGCINYATSLFKPETIERMIRHYQHIVRQISEVADKTIGAFQCLLPQELKQIVDDRNQTATNYPVGKTIGQLFEAQVANTPDDIALVFADKALSYQELNQRVNQLARYICNHYSQHNLGRLPVDTPIALCLDRSLEMVIAILAVIKAGGAYVPIDPDYPDERIQFIMADSQSRLVLTQTHLEAQLEAILETAQEAQNLTSLRLLSIDDGPYTSEQSDNLPWQGDVTDLAYVMYTSGTTGKPKGVMVEQDAVVNFAINNHFIDNQNCQTVAAISNYAFDGSIFDFFYPLLNGKRLVILPLAEVFDTHKFHLHIKTHGVDTLFATTTMFNTLAKNGLTDLPELKQIWFGGEAANTTLINKIKSSATHLSLVNIYGPTEATVYSCACDLSKYNSTQVSPIGTAALNKKLFVLDRHLMPVPIGVVGELYIGGAGLARGYLNNPELTKERFIDNPFADASDRDKGYNRLYRTGDMVRWLPDGHLEYIGRNDFQVKLRGYRIELTEIENALLQYPGVKQVAALVRRRDSDNGESHKHLIAFYVGEQGVDSAQLRQHLGSMLPEYMIPAGFVKMDAFPLTVNGKLDHNALPDAAMIADEQDYVAPQTALEQALCEIWQGLLGLEQVGVNDNFFSIGGDSILSIQLSARLRNAGYDCSVKVIFEHNTVGQLAKYLSCEYTVIETLTEQGRLSGAFDLLPVQSWFFEQVEAQQLKVYQHWNHAFLVNVPKLDATRLNGCIEKLAAHHDMLRVSYQPSGYSSSDNSGSLSFQQVYHADRQVPELMVMDVSACTAAQQYEMLTHWQSSFNLVEGPLWQIGYLHGYQDGSARIYFALHHLIVDAVSWRILIEDLQKLYAGEDLPAKTSSYRQWVETVKQYAQSNQAEQAYWQSQLAQLPDYSGYMDSRAERYQQELRLDKVTTKKLLQQANQAYHTQINDLLLTALAYTLSDWQGETIQGITLEGHGRENIDAQMDTSRTVGWFTTLYPVKLAVKASIGDSIKHIKEVLRSIPNKGIGYSALRYRRDSGLDGQMLPPISFNYLGQFDSQEETWQLSSDHAGMAMHPDNQDHNLININGMVIDGELRFMITSTLNQQIVDRLTRGFKSYLSSLVEHCLGLVNEGKREYLFEDFSDFEAFVTINEHHDEAAPIFFFPPANGGSESYYGNLVPLLKDRHLVLFNNFYHYLSERFGKSAVDHYSYEMLATQYITLLKNVQPKGPYYFIGWSFGAVLALEIVKQLTIAGEQVKDLLLIDPTFNFRKAVNHVSKKLSSASKAMIMKDINYKYYPNEGPFHYDARILLFKASQKTTFSDEVEGVKVDELAVLDDYFVNETSDNNISEYVTCADISIRPLLSSHDGWIHCREDVEKIVAALSPKSQSVIT